MKLEKENILIKYGLLALGFNEAFTPDEIRKIQQMYNKKVKLTLEYQEPILNEKERKYLSGIIAPFRNEIKCILKYRNDEYDTINIVAENEYGKRNTWLPPFKKGSMYKNMMLNKEYTLEELGL